MTHADNPLSGSSVTDTDVGYSYDLLGRLLRAQDNEGHFTALGYDGLGRSSRSRA